MVQKHADLGLLGEHFLEDGSRHSGFIIPTEHAIGHLLGIGAMNVDVMAFHAVHKLAKGSAQGRKGFEVGIREPARGESPDMTCLFDESHGHAFPGSVNGRRNSGGRRTDYNDIVRGGWESEL